MRAISFLALVATLTWGEPTLARVEHTLAYTKKQSYDAALRYLRIEKRYEVTEKDLDSGYLLFHFPSQSGGETSSGSIEIVERENGVALIVQLPEMPEYHERILATGLLKKLRADYGEAARPEKPPKKEAPPAQEPGPGSRSQAPTTPVSPPSK